jgi:cystathionine beta-lyase/cystathionine gamma-synthase
MKRYKRIDTKAVHAGTPEPRIEGAVAMPIFQSAMYEYGGEASYHDVRYLRLNNTPSQLALHRKLAALENGEAALAAASGMAAISTTLLATLAPGGHLLAQDCLYGGTHEFITRDFQTLGLSFSFIDANDVQSWETALNSSTRAIYVEAMTNPLLEVADLRAVVEFAREHRLISIIDNTFASPVNFRPLELGFDLVVHSATKYLNGHSDIVAGAVVGRADLVETITHRMNHLGGSIDAHAAYLLQRGLKTLALRVRHQNQSALTIAKFLEGHDEVVKVNYAGLQSHPQHHRARELFEGFGAVLSFELKGSIARAEAFLKSTRIPIVAPSLGGVESLLTRPVTTSHAGLSAADRKRLGITDTLIRMSVGIEATDELLEDLSQALQP